MFLIHLLVGYSCLLFCCQDLGISTILVFADDTTKYEYFANKILTWDDANDFCRNRDLALPFTLTLNELEKLRTYIKQDGILDAEVRDAGIWMGSRAEDGYWRWDFGTKLVNFNGWQSHEPKYEKRKRDGDIESCMILQNVGNKFDGGTSWKSEHCDEKKTVLCQSYE